MSTLPRGGFGEHRQGGRRRVIIVGTIVLVLLLAWSAAVLTYGRGEAGGAANARKETAGSPDNGAPATQPASRSAGEETVPEQSAYAGEEQPEQGSSGTGASAASSVPAPENTSRGTPEEPGAYDPLGTGASPGDLAPIDEDRARFAAARFISAAYGYSGSDEDAYNQGVGATVAWPDFYDSEGSREIERYAAQVGQSGTKSAALLTRLEIDETTAKSAAGYAYFQTGSGYDRDGGLSGRKRSYRQEMTLARSGATWAVRATGEIEETR